MIVNRLASGVLIMGFLASLFGCRDQQQTPATASASPSELGDTYRGLRDQILRLSTDDLQLPSDSTQPLAIVMDMGFPEGVVTLVAVADGSVSLYFGTGGGVIGAGEHEPVRHSGLAFLQLASESAVAMNQTETFPLPRRGEVRFYLVTPNGVRTAEASEDDLGNMRYEWSNLFHKGQEVISAIRAHAPS